MTDLSNVALTFKAGFDLTDISASDWQRMLSKLNIDDGVVTEVKKDFTNAVMRHWTWSASEGFIVTWCNPVTGKHLAPNMTGHYPDQLSYVGIEGTKKFVDDVVKFIRKHAILIKNESYGTRNYI